MITLMTVANTNPFLPPGISGLPADSIQAQVAFRHMGNNALMNSRSCLIHFNDVTDHTVDCRDHSLQRRLEQTDLIVEQIREEVADRNLSSNQEKNVRKHYGIYPKRWILHRTLCDPHMMSWWDPSHLLWFGLFK